MRPAIFPLHRRWGAIMPNALDAPEVLNREFLLIRAKILELAATFDRLDRAEGNTAGDPRMAQIARGLAALGLRSGDPVFASVKATEITVYPA